MKYLLKFVHLPLRQRKVLCQAFLLLPICQLCVRFLPLAILLKLFGLRPIRDPEPRPSITSRIEEILLIEWAIATAARYILFPRVFCLAQALTSRILLHRRDIYCALNIGVSKLDNRQLAAHAWLNCNGRIIKCGSEINAFNNITEFY